ncbi:MAG: acetolactate synthase small subunit [Oscillospiraceae bacterium]|nr:acetolactate synthase small subunit [Oscillospiraceae bacterium]
MEKPMEKTEKFTVELIVSNHYGVLNRITGLYSRRGYNIDSLYVNEIENSETSRMIITSKGNEYIQRQIVRQLGKLYDVKNVTLMAQVEI